ncbi:MAG: hypothetical protein AB8B69_06275 [Chitinophagales bacterium]
MDNLQDIYFEEDGELNSVGMALYVDAMRLQKVDDLPAVFHDAILQHPDIYSEIVRMYIVLEGEELEAPHPFFDKKELSLPNSADELDDFLQNIILEALKEAAIPNPDLERKVVSVVKSGSSFKVQKPTSDALCVGKIQFEWEGTFKKKMRLFLQDSKGKFIGNFQVAPGENAYTVDCSDYQSGLYYWTMTVDRNTVIGKIYVSSGEDTLKVMRANQS